MISQWLKHSSMGVCISVLHWLLYL